MDGTIADADNPSLAIGNPLPKSASRRHSILSQFKSACFDIYSQDFAMISCFNQRAQSFVDFVAASSKLFLAIAWLSDCHRFYLVSIPSDFNTSYSPMGAGFRCGICDGFDYKAIAAIIMIGCLHYTLLK